jgi:FMN phosphatase YigB (HAD superfamily)
MARDEKPRDEQPRDEKPPGGGPEVPPIRAIVFDLFDTLVDLHMERIPPVEFKGKRIASTTPALHETLRSHVADVGFDRFAETLQAVDSEFRESRYAKGLELPTEERFAALLDRLGASADGLLDALVEIHMGALREQVRAVDHHPAVLRELREGARLGLCSNFSHSRTALRVLDEAALSEHLDAVVVSDVGGIRKPRPEIFEEVLDALGAKPEETLHVGDNIVADVSGAAALGIRTVWLTRRVPDPAKSLAAYAGPAPDYQFRDLEELLPLLSRAGR